MKDNNNRKADKEIILDVMEGAVIGAVIVGCAYAANSLHPVLSEEKRQQLRNKKHRE